MEEAAIAFDEADEAEEEEYGVAAPEDFQGVRVPLLAPELRGGVGDDGAAETGRSVAACRLTGQLALGRSPERNAN